MRASLDTNVIIHFYRAGLQDILFNTFEDGVFIYEQIRSVELVNHAENDLLKIIDSDIDSGKIELYTDAKLKEQKVYSIFQGRVEENRQLYNPGDLGEVYAISLAQTIGAYSIITDDIKQGGPYMSLLQFVNEEIMPFTFADVLILRYLIGFSNEQQTLWDFDAINKASDLNWSFKSQIRKFIDRFIKNTYDNKDKDWFDKMIDEYDIRVKSRITSLVKLL